MAGLRKAKKYDWKDSNLALFGSDTEKQVKKESAQTETAWKGAGDKIGLRIWRIVKFKVVSWPKEEYGKFYQGDSYIVLNTYKEEESDELLYDIHFWIGKHSTQDEYGTAAYKTVELDTLLDDKPVQHREVQGHESDLFKSYFNSITLLEGGADTGFRHVKPEEYKTRFLHFSGQRKHITVKEVPCNKSKLNSDDVFILDAGLKIIQFNGKDSNKDERMKAAQYLQSIKADRGGKPAVEVMEDPADRGELENLLTGDEDEVDDDEDEQDSGSSEKKLFRLSDASGKMEFNLIREGTTSRQDLDSADVFVLDTCKHVFVWIGQGTSSAESKNAMTYAHNYLMKSTHPLIPVTCIKEGKESTVFKTAIAA